MTTLAVRHDTDARTDALTDALAELVAAIDTHCSVHAGFDLAAERDVHVAARQTGRPHVSIRVGPDEVLVGPTGGVEHERVVSSLLEAGAEVTTAERGLVGVLGELRWEVLWPKSGASAGNDASIVLAVTPGTECACLSALMLGDLGEEAQARVLAGGLPAVDVVKVAHHGSADQAPRLYEAVRASVALIGVGAENTYGHPTDSLLATLRSTHSTVFRSDRDGLILVSPGPAVWVSRVAPHG